MEKLGRYYLPYMFSYLESKMICACSHVDTHHNDNKGCTEPMYKQGKFVFAAFEGKMKGYTPMGFSSKAGISYEEGEYIGICMCEKFIL